MDVKQRRVKALGYGEQRIEALGQTPYLDFELKDGSTIRLPHPMRLDDAALMRFEAFQRGDGLDREPLLDENGEPRVDAETGRPVTRIVEPNLVDGHPAEPYMVRVMKAVVGEGDYNRLAAHGLTATELNQIWQDMAADHPGTVLVEDDDDPKG